MFRLIRIALKMPFLTGVAIFSLFLMTALVISAFAERKQNRRFLALRERAKKQHQLSQQRARQSDDPDQETKTPPGDTDLKTGK
jgi:hypothetical protein